jgi:hypothetical protein
MKPYRIVPAVEVVKMADLQVFPSVSGDGGNRTRGPFPPCQTGSSPVSPITKTSLFAGTSRNPRGGRAIPEGDSRRRPESWEIFARLIRGEATSAEYVAAVRAEAEQAVAELIARGRRKEPS